MPALQYIDVQTNEITRYWNELIRTVARQGGISYTELKAMDVTEFFVTLVNFEKEIAAQNKANKEAINKSKSKGNGSRNRH